MLPYFSHFLLIPFLVSPPVAYASPHPDHGTYDPAIIEANGVAISAPPKNDAAFTCRALGIAMGGGASLVTSDMGEVYDELIEDN